MVIVLCELLEVRLSWMVTATVLFALFVLWCVLVVRAMIGLARALGLKRGVAPACLHALTVAVMVPAVVFSLGRLPLFFWWNRVRFDEAALRAEQGAFPSEQLGYHTFLVLPPPYDGLSDGGRARVVEWNGRKYVVFVRSAYAGEFTGYCRIAGGRAPGGDYRAYPVRGAGSAWFCVVMD